MSIQPITPAEVALLQQTVKEGSTAITKQTADLAGKLFATLKDEGVALPEGMGRKELEDLSGKVKDLALDGLGWSSFRKVISAIRNFLSSGVSSAHLLYRELGKDDIQAHLQKIETISGNLKGRVESLEKEVNSMRYRGSSFYGELKEGSDEKEKLKEIVSAVVHVGGALMEELEVVYSEEEQDKKVEDKKFEECWQRICSNIKSSNESLQKISNKLYYKYIEWLDEEII